MTTIGLARYLQERPRPAPGEKCEFCARPLDGEHSHVVDTIDRRVMCACRPCYIVFLPQGAARGRYKTVPDRYEAIADFELSGPQWDALQIPIGLAFFFFNSAVEKVVAFYPGPAGATESLLPLGSWDEFSVIYPQLAGMEPDVEAALVRRTRGGAQRCFIVPIDACYELVGLIRTTWKGFDGGQEAWAEIDGFFERIARKAAEADGSLA